MVIFRPDMLVKSVDEIDFEKLIEQGKSFFIFDFDNTLGYWRSSKIEDKFEKIIEKIKSLGGQILIASNGRERNLSTDSVRILWRSRKPFVYKIRKILKELKLNNTQVVVIGDQIFTDILAGKILGAYTIKVTPLSKKEFLGTKFLRLVEWITMPLWKR